MDTLKHFEKTKKKKKFRHNKTKKNIWQLQHYKGNRKKGTCVRERERVSDRGQQIAKTLCFLPQPLTVSFR